MKKGNIKTANFANVATLAALAGVTPVERGMDTPPGVIHMANETRFIESNFSEPLTTFAVGWRDPGNLVQLLGFVAPDVPTARRFEFAKATNAEQFLSETDDVRGIGADFKRVEFTSDKVDAKTLNKGLIVVVDRDNVAGMPNWREVYTGRLMQRLYRNEARRAITLLAAAATNTAKTWDTTVGKDPDQDVSDMLVTANDDSGIYPNRVLYGQVAWQKRAKAHRAQTAAGGFSSAGLSPEAVAGLLGVDQVYVSKERYQSGAATKSKIVGDIVIGFTAEAGQTPEDPSNIKRFTSPTEGGTPFRVYEQELNSKLIAITVEHYSSIIVTSTLGMQKLTIS